MGAMIMYYKYIDTQGAFMNVYFGFSTSHTPHTHTHTTSPYTPHTHILSRLSFILSSSRLDGGGAMAHSGTSICIHLLNAANKYLHKCVYEYMVWNMNAPHTNTHSRVYSHFCWIYRIGLLLLNKQKFNRIIVNLFAKLKGIYSSLSTNTARIE